MCRINSKPFFTGGYAIPWVPPENVYCHRHAGYGMDLATMSCTPEQDISSPLTRREVMERMHDIPGWQLKEGYLVRRFSRADFEECMEFINEIAELAKKQGHFPNICIIENRYIDIIWYSHHCGGLTINDFIMAAKLNAKELAKIGTSF